MATQKYQDILRRMLERVRGVYPAMDTREGSLMWTACAPAAFELSMLYDELDRVMRETYADTATRDYLIRRAAERGLAPYPATRGVFEGAFNIPVDTGERFNQGLYNFEVGEVLEGPSESSPYFRQSLVCESAGSAPNGSSGRLTPIGYVEGLQYAQLIGLLIPGEDEEDTERFRRRYMDSLVPTGFGGNIKDYMDKAHAIPGVGGVKVKPAWNGGGTVKLVIMGADYQPPTQALIDLVQETFDPDGGTGTTGGAGQGLGLAPIDHVVTVVGASTVAVNVAADIVYAGGYDWDAVRPGVWEALEAYFLGLRMEWEPGDLVVRVTGVEQALLGVRGIVDVMGTRLNGLEENLALKGDQLPVRGNVNGA